MNASVSDSNPYRMPANDEELIRIVDEVIAYIKSTGLNCYVGLLRRLLKEITTN